MTAEVVIPSAGRPTLPALVEALRGLDVILVDDRSDGAAPLLDPVPSHVRVVRGPARGPAAARNAGWRRSRADWVAFLDDDVEPEAGWADALRRDLAGAGPDVGGVQGRIVVPLPAGRRPTDWERSTRGLETARWATADLAYRREVLDAVGGFDERFPRAYREDADLGLRVTASGRRIVVGERVVRHPVRPAPPWVSLAKQAGNADDVLMRRLHGGDWRERAGVPRGRRPRHLATAAAGALAAGLAAGGRRRAAAVAGTTWLAGTAELAAARIAPGPRTPREVATMLWTSALMPFAATAWYLHGHVTAARGPSPRDHGDAEGTAPSPSKPPSAVLFDRDGTLVKDVPYNGDPDRVELVDGAREALARLRAAGVPAGVVSNQSGIARGLISDAQVRAVNARVQELLGQPIGPWAWCPHGPGDGCDCRKPAPGLIRRAAAELGVDPADCVVIGDIGADVEAARAAGARGILVPTPVTRAEEVADAEEVEPDLVSAVERALGRAG
ncbi:MAG TPA: HAD-IIIA family hydrolase [Solirubrobacteraceae bacterium]|nr:HAD-IIIA family hydrolase [Solirubrobacteraceae bacterium]